MADHTTDINELAQEFGVDVDRLALKDHKWTIIFRNGVKHEFLGGWNAVGSNPSPSLFLSHVEDFHSQEKVPGKHAVGQRVRYRFPRNDADATGVLLSIDIREVVAVQVTLM